MAHRFVKQRLIDRSREYFIRQVQRADLPIVQIDNIYAWHGYFLALRTTT